MKKRLVFGIITVLIISLAGCATPQEGAVSGGLGGAAVGAAIGALIGAAAGAPDLGAAIGAGIGGAVGTAAGASAGARNLENEMRQANINTSLIPANWRGPNGELTGQLIKDDRGRFCYVLGEDYLVWDAANKCWVTED